ncbi:unnamed protein product, partial [Laminaria digitata]
PISGCWGKLLSGGAHGVLSVPAVFRECILRVLTVFRPSVLLILPVLAVFREFILRFLLLELPVLVVFRPSELLVLPVLAVFRTPVLRYSQYSQYKMYWILRVFSEYEVYWEHLCNIAHVGQIMI